MASVCVVRLKDVITVNAKSVAVVFTNHMNASANGASGVGNIVQPASHL